MELRNSHATFFGGCIVKLLMTFKFLNGLLYCTPDLFVFNASPNTRVSHSSQLVVPAKTAAYFNSFYVSTTFKALSNDTSFIKLGVCYQK